MIKFRLFLVGAFILFGQSILVSPCYGESVTGIISSIEGNIASISLNRDNLQILDERDTATTNRLQELASQNTILSQNLILSLEQVGDSITEDIKVRAFYAIGEYDSAIELATNAIENSDSTSVAIGDFLGYRALSFLELGANPNFFNDIRSSFLLIPTTEPLESDGEAATLINILGKSPRNKEVKLNIVREYFIFSGRDTDPVVSRLDDEINILIDLRSVQHDIIISILDFTDALINGDTQTINNFFPYIQTDATQVVQEFQPAIEVRVTDIIFEHRDLSPTGREQAEVTYRQEVIFPGHVGVSIISTPLEIQLDGWKASIGRVDPDDDVTLEVDVE